MQIFPHFIILKLIHSTWGLQPCHLKGLPDRTQWLTPMLKQNLKATAMPWEKHTLRVVDRRMGEKTPSMGDKLMVANKFLVVEKSLLVDHNKWH